MLVATHSGPFHADDVLAWALIQVFHDPNATVIRTRDDNKIQRADMVIDVGSSYDPDTLRFDHHQHSYQGPLSSAGMILEWLSSDQKIPQDLAKTLRDRLVDYVDDVDNGRRFPDPNVPCFAKQVEAYNNGCQTLEDFDRAFGRAGEMARALVEGITAGHNGQIASKDAILKAMSTAKDANCNVIFLDRYHSWKACYFANGGQSHPTEFIVMPGVDGRWRSLAIPPEKNSFAQKRPFPDSWAGLRDEQLEQVTGVSGSLFCHKNRFIAVFQTRQGVLDAMQRFGLIDGPIPENLA